MEQILGEKAEAFLLGAQRFSKPVNRSLTPAENEVQRLFNRQLGSEAAKVVAVPLLHQYPPVVQQGPWIPAEIVERIQEVNRDAMVELNRWLPEEEALTLDVPDGWRTQGEKENCYHFTEEQLELLVRSICRYFEAPADTEASEQEAEAPGSAESDTEGPSFDRVKGWFHTLRQMKEEMP